MIWKITDKFQDLNRYAQIALLLAAYFVVGLVALTGLFQSSTAVMEACAR